jgi:hypothetical protein
MFDVVPVFVGLGLASLLGGLLMDQSEWLSKRLKPWLSRNNPRRQRLFRALDRTKPAQVGYRLVLAVCRRDRQTFGQRLMRIRRVDATDGGSVTIRSAIVRYCLFQVIRVLAELATGPTAKRERQKLDALGPDLDALTLKYPEDADAFEREARLLKRERLVKGMGSSAAPGTIQLAVHLVPIVLLPKRQSLSDLAAGVVTASTGAQAQLDR